MHRRQFVLATSGLAAGAVLPNRLTARQATPTSDGLQPDGSWQFTDDRGQVISRSTTPTRILADAAAGIALWELGITPIGLVGYANLLEVPEELAEIPYLDLSSGELDVEQALGLEPDIYVGQIWDQSDLDYFYGFESADILIETAPIVGILAVGVPLDQSLARFEELAGALGVDLSAPETAQHREDFQAASEKVRAAATAKPGLKVMAATFYEDAVWIGNPESASDLALFANLGVELYVPETTELSGVFVQLSWETLGEIPIDLYLRDDRSDTLTPEQMINHPIFSLLPAGKANQLGDWSIEYIPSYGAVTTILERLAEDIQKSEVVTG